MFNNNIDAAVIITPKERIKITAPTTKKLIIRCVVSYQYQTIMFIVGKVVKWGNSTKR